jgi:hypothetical protein
MHQGNRHLGRATEQRCPAIVLQCESAKNDHTGSAA